MSLLGFTVTYSVFHKSDAKIKITITATNLIRIKYSHSSFNYHLSGANVANLNKIHCTVFEQQLFKKMDHKNRSFQYGKVGVAVCTQYHQLHFVLKVVAICTVICMSFVQTVRSLLLPEFLSADPVAASICRRSRSSAEQDQCLSGNSSNNFLALKPLLCLKALISIPSSLVKIIAFYVNQMRHKNVTNIMSLFLTLPAVSMLIGSFHIGKFCF